MAEYEPDEMATYYFVIRDNHSDKIIRGWTNKKQLAEIYIDFHKCPSYHLKKITKPIEEFKMIIDDNIHDEIGIGNIRTRNRDKKKKNEIKTISIPATETELRFIREECNTFCTSMVGYAYLNEAIPFMKKKYREALEDILLWDIIQKEVNYRRGKNLQGIEFDELMILCKFFPDDFGK